MLLQQVGREQTHSCLHGGGWKGEGEGSVYTFLRQILQTSPFLNNLNTISNPTKLTHNLSLYKNMYEDADPVFTGVRYPLSGTRLGGLLAVGRPGALALCARVAATGGCLELRAGCTLAAGLRLHLLSCSRCPLWACHGNCSMGVFKGELGQQMVS